MEVMVDPFLIEDSVCLRVMVRRTPSRRGGRRGRAGRTITAGVLITLYLVTYVVIGAISMPIPILFLLMPMLVALFAAPTYHMLLAKTKSSTAIFIAAVLPSIILVATGHIPIAPLVSIPAGIIALLIAKNGNYEDFKKNAISHLFFSLNLFGGFIPIWVMREAFFKSVTHGGLDQSFCDTVRALTPLWMLPAMIIGTFVFSLVGSYLTFKKIVFFFCKLNEETRSLLFS